MLEDTDTFSRKGRCDGCSDCGIFTGKQRVAREDCDLTAQPRIGLREFERDDR